MFDPKQLIYSRPDGSFVITYAGNPYHLSQEDPHVSDELWDEVTAFIAENPAAVQPEPPPPEPEPMPEPTTDYFLMMQGFLDTLSAR